MQVDILMNNAGVTPVPDVHFSQDKLGNTFHPYIFL
jgi:NADP-dependent 3-hydroxy acid dehydrogenase YdfG